ncbi:putative UDP-arabinose 4-epimerase 3 [Hibiscus syriacus]|uniref:UDP-arabinose 4-epimerase 3 n=1 Tax=Hibiscus syriacus TaxID=106335 RepID=A0A6A2X629_HIBSY|nr:putative UDP-arabinose 4-epimerase 3 [Hibiscus syriacus]
MKTRENESDPCRIQVLQLWGVEDGSEEEDGERAKAGLKKRSNRIFYFSVPHEEEEECSMESEPAPMTRQFFPLDKDQEMGSSSGFPPSFFIFLASFNVPLMFFCFYFRVPINPYEKAKKMAEDIIMDFSKNSDMAILQCDQVRSRPEGRLGDAAHGIILGLKVKGMDYKTHDGTCIRDYIDVTNLVDAHVKALQNAKPHKVGIYNVGTGRGRSVKEFVEACKKATGVKIKVDYLPRRPGDYAKVFSDPTKIRRELNWIARFTDLQESLQIAWRWQKAHHDGYTSAS